MPTYDYRCNACQYAFEHFQSMKDKHLRKCPNCGKAALERLIGTGAAVVFKGSGFYQTDYRSESYKKAAQAEHAAATPATAGAAAATAPAAASAAATAGTAGTPGNPSTSSAPSTAGASSTPTTGPSAKGGAMSAPTPGPTSKAATGGSKDTKASRKGRGGAKGE